jgi:hypothetical protein
VLQRLEERFGAIRKSLRRGAADSAARVVMTMLNA